MKWEREEWTKEKEKGGSELMKKIIKYKKERKIKSKYRKEMKRGRENKWAKEKKEKGRRDVMKNIKERKEMNRIKH